VAEHGKNVMSPPPSRLFGQIMGYFFGGFGSILLGAGILVFISWRPLGDPPAQANLALACVLIAVWVIQAAFNAWQDWSTSRVMASIGTMLPDQCLVMRNGSQASVSALDLVPGDVIVIKQGNKLPADVRFVEVSSDAMFDRAILTGKHFSNSLCCRHSANMSQVNRNLYTQLSTRPRKTILRQTTLVCKARTAFREAVWECVSPLVTALSSDALRNSHPTRRLA
jgi:magnesium-transporting ATPase (P-type)